MADLAVAVGRTRLPPGSGKGLALAGSAAAIAVAAVAGLLAVAGPGHRSPPAAIGPADLGYGGLPLSFQPNRGQSDPAVRFLSTGAGYGLFLTDRRAVLSLSDGSVLSMRLVGARPAPRIGGHGRLPGEVNYLGGSGSRSETGIPTYSAVRYAGVWPGVGMRFYGNQRRLEYDFELAPGARPGAIGLRFSGQRRLRIDRTGGLALDLGGRTIRQLPPHAFQTIGGARRPVTSRYVLRHGRVGIDLGAYDHRRALTVDPQLVYSTYLGREIDGRGSSIAVDPSGHAYITGYTSSPKFPITPGALQTKPPGRSVAFVTKLSRNGRRAVYSTYLGGGSGSSGEAIVVDRAGDAFVTGLAYAAGFPTTGGAFQAVNPGFENGFVAKLNPTGRRLLYSTYLGSHGEEGGFTDAIAIDRAGDAYVAGYTFSKEFPTTPGAAQGTSSVEGETDGFVAKLNPSGSRLLYSTYLGGSDSDDAHGIAVDAAGDAYVTGSTASRDFPTTPGAFQRANRAGHEFTNAYVTKLNPAGSRFLYSTYLGGGGLDQGIAIAVDSRGDAHVTGEAGSSSFPTTPGAFQARLRGFADVFVATLSRSGRKLLRSTLLGGESRGRGIALDRAGNVYLTGLTNSKHFPTTRGALQRSNRSRRGYNGFVAKLNPAETRLLYSTYLGGHQTRASSIALDHAGAVYVTGGTGPAFPVTRHGLRQTYHPAKPGYPNAFVAKLNPR